MAFPPSIPTRQRSPRQEKTTCSPSGEIDGYLGRSTSSAKTGAARGADATRSAEKSWKRRFERGIKGLRRRYVEFEDKCSRVRER